MVEGEGIWLSDKIAKLPEKFRAEYANILPLAMADGIFKCEPRRVWSTVYSYNRPEISVEYVTEMLNVMEGIGLIFRAELDGQKWAFFIGIDKPGRLPEPSKRGRYTTSGLHPESIRTMFGHLLQSAHRNGSGPSEGPKLTPEQLKQYMRGQSAKNKAHKK